MSREGRLDARPMAKGGQIVALAVLNARLRYAGRLFQLDSRLPLWRGLAIGALVGLLLAGVCATWHSGSAQICLREVRLCQIGH